MSFVDRVTAERDRRESESESVRRFSHATIARVVAANQGKRDIDVSLAIGAACPYHTRWEKDIWVEEARKLH